ncbi:hypothetical protein C8R41DRAFT_872311 [Lentinula lateritia]|uniref:Alpha-type protein kinase domain-containing protein n=1 Tax=Lentinula lateritia TaxID=40482 RepID=A0ABQ8UWX7_9AGAR|nr:hypothetical protein C8R41DRAFT_872311 [Lentinula lateritia]
MNQRYANGLPARKFFPWELNVNGSMEILEGGDFFVQNVQHTIVKKPQLGESAVANVTASLLLPSPQIDEAESIRKENAQAQRGEPGQEEVRVGALPTAQPASTTSQYIQDRAGRVFLVPALPPPSSSGYITSASQPLVVRSSTSFGFHPTIAHNSSGVQVGLPGLPSALPLSTLAPPASSLAASLNGQGYGYTASHSIYNVNRSQMAGMAYATDIEKKVMIEALMIVIPGVHINIGMHALKALALSKILPMWQQWSSNYPLSICNISMKDKNWLEFEPLNIHDTDAIKAQYYSNPKKANAPPAFKKDYKASILLHVPNRIISKVEYKKATKTYEQDQESTGAPTRSPSPTVGSSRLFKPSTPPQESYKKTRKGGIPSVYRSPDREKLAAALRAEKMPKTTNNVAILWESAIPVRVFHAKNLHLDQLILLAGRNAAWSEYCEEGTPSTLFVDLSEKKAAKGKFKITSLGQSEPPIFDGPEVAVKQLFFTKTSINSKPSKTSENISKGRETTVVKHFYPCDPENQHRALVMKLKVIQYGQALLNLVYAYIQSVNPSENVDRFIEIPKFRFVQTALAVEQVPLSTPGTRPQVFLLEEDLLAMNKGPFKKYMSNMPHIFMIFDNSEDAVRADFLRFTQHVMYWKTGKIAYISDYQGNSSTLTDYGNVPEGFEGLETHHDCNNRFCEFFNLPKMNKIPQACVD